jgi:hypothetical protein
MSKEIAQLKNDLNRQCNISAERERINGVLRHDIETHKRGRLEKETEVSNLRKTLKMEQAE